MHNLYIIFVITSKYSYQLTLTIKLEILTLKNQYVAYNAHKITLVGL